jgi:predicted nucleotidyltransferase component of viral defense system
MIPKAYIERWQDNAPWSMLAMVEQDMVISRALVELYQHPDIVKSLAFRGGTALNKLFITPAVRYSEDLDFVQIPDEPIGNIIDIIRSKLDHWLGEPRRNFTKRSTKLIYRYNSIDGVQARLKIEINITEHFQVEPLQHCEYSMSSKWFSGGTTITSYTLDELMGTKLRALYQRRKGRDLFDLWFALKMGTINANKVISIFEKYCAYNDEPITRAMFERSIHFKKQNNDFKTDILPLLISGTQWDFDAAMNLVETAFIQKLKGKPWKNTEDL